jgi:hypothetical protein
MLTDRESLVKEIERLEKEMEAQHFRGLFDHKSRHQKEKRLKKLRRELAELDGTAVHLEPFRKLESEPEPAPKPTAKPAPLQPAKRTQEAQATKKASPPAPPARKLAGAAKPSTKATASSKAKSGGATRTTAKKPAGPASKTGKKK